MTLADDLHGAFRTLRRSPGFTCAAVLSLGLGIGANTAIFSILNSLFLRPPGVARPAEVVAPRVTYKKLNLIRISMSAPDFADVRSSTDVFSVAAMAQPAGYNYTGAASPERFLGAQVTSQWFDVFEAKPILGRTFRPEDDQPGANQVVVLSFQTWRQLFGGDRGVLGRVLELDRRPYRVVGVVAEDFVWPPQATIWTPLGLAAKAYGPDNRFNENYFAVARLRKGVSYNAAQNFMHLLTKRANDSNANNAGFAKRAEWSMGLMPFLELTNGNVQTPMLILMGAVALVLLIACSNIAGLMLARAAGRSRELAIRTSLGAGRTDLVRQAFAESLLLSLAGTALGLLAVSAILKAIVSIAPAQFVAGLVVQIDLFVLLFAIGIGLTTALLFGLAPAYQMSRLGLRHEQLKEGGRSNTEGSERQRLRASLVVSQVALAVVLLFGAGLFLRSLARLRTVDTGFETHGVMTASVILPDAPYHEVDKQSAFYRAMLAKLSGQPGVESAAVVVPLPFSQTDGSASFSIEGRNTGPRDPGPHGDFRSVSADYHKTMGIRLLAGRYFTDADRKESDPVVIIDEKVARRYWPNENPVGKRMRNGDNKTPWATIVGMVASVKHSDLASSSQEGAYYYPVFQPTGSGVTTAFVVVRGSGGPAAMGESIRRAVSAVDPGLAVFDLKTMDQRIELSLGSKQFAVSMLAAFAAMALLLAALGLYGVISYNVAQRTRELGLRAALGARPQQILGMVVGQGFRLVLIGAIAGSIVAALLARVVSSELFRVSIFDPATFLLTVVTLGAVALVAAFLPAWRAARVDPMTALRDE